MGDERRVVEEGYDVIAETYAEARRQMSRRDEKYLRLLSERLERGSKVLDLGCGSGIPITKFLAKYYQVTGVDISQKQVELARELVPEATFHKGDMTEVSFPDESFDAICSFFAIIHVPREEHGALFKRLYNMIRKGGLLLLNLGSSDWVSTDEDRWFGVRMYWSHYDSETNKRLVEDTGFRIIHSSIEGEEFQGIYEQHLYLIAEKADLGVRHSSKSAVFD